MNLVTERATVRFDPALAAAADLSRAITEAGYEVSAVRSSLQEAVVPNHTAAGPEPLRDREMREGRALRRDLLVAAALNVPLLIIGMSHGAIPGTEGTFARWLQFSLATAVVLGPGWRVLRNAIIDHRRRLGAAERKLAAFGQEVEDRAEPDIEMHGAICQCVGALAATLEPDYAEALRTVEVEGIAVKDYAKRAGISTSNAGVRVFRAREALRRQVARSCGTCADHGCLDCTCAPNSSGCGH